MRDPSRPGAPRWYDVGTVPGPGPREVSPAGEDAPRAAALLHDLRSRGLRPSLAPGASLCIRSRDPRATLDAPARAALEELREPIRWLLWREALEATVEDWPTSRPLLSEHLRLEVAAAHRRGRPLGPGVPVPACGCPACTGIAADHPARRALRRRRPRRDLRPALDLDAARAVPVVEVARRLGLGEPRRIGRELHVRCPLHEDGDPSLRIAPDGRRWYCDPCGEGGDSIALLMRAKRLSFPDAVRELVA